MIRKSLIKASTACSLLLLLTSCGDSSLGGGVGEFKTVIVSAATETPRLESDVLSGNTCGATGSTGGTFTTDSVVVTVSSVKQSSTGNALNVVLDSVNISYTPVNGTTPPIPDEIVSLTGNTITPDGSIQIPVPVAKDIVKASLVGKGLQPCTGAYYEYYVTMSFNAVEIGTGERGSINARMNVAFADRTI